MDVLLAVAVPVGVMLCVAIILLAAMVAMLLLQRRRTKMAILEACPRNDETVCGTNNQGTGDRAAYREGKSHVNAGFVSDSQERLYGNVQARVTSMTPTVMAAPAGQSKEQVYQNVMFASGQRNGQSNVDDKRLTVSKAEDEVDECYDDIRCQTEETREQPLYDEPCAVLEAEADEEQSVGVTSNNSLSSNPADPDSGVKGSQKKPPIPLPRKPSLKPKPKCWKTVKAVVDTTASFKKENNEKPAKTYGDDVTLVENDIYVTK